MNPPQIPDRVFEFLAARIDTVPQLEALLLLWEDPERLWSAPEVASRIYVSADEASSILQALERRQLVHAVPEPTPCYRFHAPWPDSAAILADVAAAYRRHVVRLATFIHSGVSSSVREFARAFDLKKDR